MSSMSNYLRRQLRQNIAEAAAGLQPIAARPHSSSLKIEHWYYPPVRCKHRCTFTSFFFHPKISWVNVRVKSPCDMRDGPWAARRWSARDPKIISFDSIPACDRQTDGHAVYAFVALWQLSTTVDLFFSLKLRLITSVFTDVRRIRQSIISK